MKDSLPHVAWEDLDEDYTAGGVLRLLFNGEPFTGIAIETNERGTVTSEESYIDGFLDGVSNEWFEDGKPCATSTYKWNRLHGRSQEWFKSGTLKNDSVYELGILVSKQTWNEQGDMVSDYTIEQNSEQQTILAQTKVFFHNNKLTY